MNRLVLIVGLTAALTVALFPFASSASAAVRYASPGATGTTGCTAPGTSPGPCNIVNAYNSAANGDEVIVEPGDYGSSAAPITTLLLTVNLVNLHGVAGQPMPRLFLGAPGGLDVYNGSTASNLYIEYASASGSALFIYSSSVDHVFVNAASGTACRVVHNSAITNSVCLSRGAGATALTYGNDGDVAMPRTLTLRNVTAWSNGAGGTGLTSQSTGGYRAEIDATNSIIHGEAGDIAVTASADPPTFAHVVLDHSNYATALAFPNDATVTAAGTGTNQTAKPLLADPANGNVHQLLNSPTIDAGIDAPANGTIDLDGLARLQGVTTDIGAYEFTPVTAALSGLSLSSAKFRAAAKGASIAGLNTTAKKKKKAPVGTTIKFTLNEAATVAFTIEKATVGRRSGKKCVKATRKNRGKRRCTRYVAVKGSFSASATTGANSFKFSGRFNGKKLSPGRYKLVGTPTAAGSGPGAPVTTRFTIVR